MMLFWMLCTCLFTILYGQDVGFQYDRACYKVGETVTMTAEYTGMGTVTVVQWYYSGQLASNLFVVASSCTVSAPVDAGYPTTSRMSFECDLAKNTFKLKLTEVQEEELNTTWGATFSLSVGSSPTVKQEEVTECNATTSTTSTTNTTTTNMSSPAATSTATKPTEPTTFSKKKSIFIGAGVGGGVVVLLFIFVVVTFYCKQRTKRQKYKQKRVHSYQSENRNAAYCKGNVSVQRENMTT